MLVTANIFQPLIDVFESVLKAFHSGGFSWGLSIVLLTVASAPCSCRSPSARSRAWCGCRRCSRR